MVDDIARARATLVVAKETIKSSFGVAHATIQVEDQALRSAESELAF